MSLKSSPTRRYPCTLNCGYPSIFIPSLHLKNKSLFTIGVDVVDFHYTVILTSDLRSDWLFTYFSGVTLIPL